MERTLVSRPSTEMVIQPPTEASFVPNTRMIQVQRTFALEGKDIGSLVRRVYRETDSNQAALGIFLGIGKVTASSWVHMFVPAEEIKSRSQAASDSNRKRWQNPEFREAIVTKIKANWDDPERRRQMDAAIHTQEANNLRRYKGMMQPHGRHIGRHFPDKEILTSRSEQVLRAIEDGRFDSLSQIQKQVIISLYVPNPDGTFPKVDSVARSFGKSPSRIRDHERQAFLELGVSKESGRNKPKTA